MNVLEIPIETSLLLLRLYLRIFETYISGLSVLMSSRCLHTLEGYLDLEILMNFKLALNSNSDAEHEIRYL